MAGRQARFFGSGKWPELFEGIAAVVESAVDYSKHNVSELDVIISDRGITGSSGWNKAPKVAALNAYDAAIEDDKSVEDARLEATAAGDAAQAQE